MLSAEELHRRAVAAFNAGRTARARRLLDAARERATDPAARARIEASLAYLAIDTSDLHTALELCDQALGLPDLPVDIHGVLLAQRAVIYRRAGRVEAALTDFEAAIDRLVGLPRDLGTALMNRGTVHLDRGAWAAAIADFEASAEAYLRAGDEVAAAQAQHNRGYAQFRGGDLVGALDAMAAAQRVLAPVSPVMRAVGEQDRAEAMFAAGLRTAGAEALREAARAYGVRRLRQRQADAELALATNLLSDRPDEARRVARAASRRFERIAAPALRARADGVALAAEVALGGRSPRLLAQGEAVAARLRGEGLEQDARRLDVTLARVEARRGDVTAARRRLARLRVGRRDPLAVRLLTAEVRAETEVAAGRPGTALARLRTGLCDLHEWQSSFGSLDLQTNVVGHGVRLAVRGLELAVASRSPAVLFEWSERARMLASRVQPVRTPPDSELARDLAELRTEPGPVREEELRRRIRERAWRRRGSGAVAEPVTLAEAQQRLDADTVVVAYVVAAGVLVALVVTADRAVRHELGPVDELDRLLGGLLPDLDVAASELPEPMAGAVRAELADRLARIADLLVAPLAAELGDRKVVLTPSGRLAGVPWSLLSGLARRPVVVAQSVTTWLSRSATPLRTLSAGFVAGPRVVRAEPEVWAAQKAWGSGTVLVGPDATAAAVSSLAAEVDVLHVAAHGRHSADNPLFSGLQLADGGWYGYDIDQLGSVPDVVLLSACEVGRSSVRWGEELIGMTAAWLHAGARCVIASAAAVNDATAHDVLVGVHDGLAAGEDPASALAAALVEGVGDAPAPFVCFG